MEQKISIVPEPKSIKTTGNWLKFTGIKNCPAVLKKYFGIKTGDFAIEKIANPGIGIQISDKQIKIWGDENICYSTLYQLILHKKGFLPELRIEESLKHDFRAYHHDIARGGVLTVDSFKKLLRLLFICKYNYFFIYFEDLFSWEKYPDIGSARGKLTREELTEIIGYGKQLGIEICPSLELMGHMEWIFRIPAYSKFSEKNFVFPAGEDCLNGSDDEAKQFAYDLLQEVIDFFKDAKYIHIGGDETWSSGRYKSLDKFNEYRAPEMYLEHHKNMIEIVRKNNKIPVLWGDMLTGMYLHKEIKHKWENVINSKVWDDVLIANWDYASESKEHFDKKIKLFGSREQIICPGTSNWGRYYPDYPVAEINIMNFSEAAKENNTVKGFLLTSWGDDGAESFHVYQEPLILAQMECIEGNGDWVSKWLNISQESMEILEVRKQFGTSQVINITKPVLLCNSKLEKKDVSLLKKIIKDTEKIKLDEYLSLTRELIGILLKKSSGKLKPADILGYVKKYARLWLKERKKANLNVVTNKFKTVYADVSGYDKKVLCIRTKFSLDKRIKNKYK